MVGVSGIIKQKDLGKGKKLVLDYDWESYPYHQHEGWKSKNFDGRLNGNGESTFLISLWKGDKQLDVINAWEYEGGGEMNFDLLKDVPEQVLKGWTKVKNEYDPTSKKGIQKLRA